MSVQTPTDDGDGSEEPDQTPPQLMVDERPIAELLPYLPRRRPYDINAIVGAAASISADGFPHPVILGYHGQIVDGALLIDAARWLDRETVPCLSLAGMGGGEGRCLRDALAALNAKRTWCIADLEAEWQARVKADSQIGLEGFPPIDLDQLMPEPETEADKSDGAE